MASPVIRVEDRFGRGGQPDDLSGVPHRPAAFLPQRGPAAGSHNQPPTIYAGASAAEVGNYRGLQVAKGRLALLGKNPRDRLSRATFDFHIGVDPVPVQSLGQVPCEGRFSGGTVANEDKIHHFLTFCCRICIRALCVPPETGTRSVPDT